MLYDTSNNFCLLFWDVIQNKIVHFAKQLFKSWEQLFRFLATFEQLLTISGSNFDLVYCGTIYKGLGREHQRHKHECQGRNFWGSRDMLPGNFWNWNLWSAIFCLPWTGFDYIWQEWSFVSNCMSYISGQNKAQLYLDEQIQDNMVYLHFRKKIIWCWLSTGWYRLKQLSTSVSVKSGWIFTWPL